jgi:hypothetical protein
VAFADWQLFWAYSMQKWKGCWYNARKCGQWCGDYHVCMANMSHGIKDGRWSGHFYLVEDVCTSRVLKWGWHHKAVPDKTEKGRKRDLTKASRGTVNQYLWRGICTLGSVIGLSTYYFKCS